MRKILKVLTVLLLSMAFTPGLLADPWNVNDPIDYTVPALGTSWIGGYVYNPVQPVLEGYGGLFKIHNNNTGADIYTFCLEMDENIHDGDYVAGISDSAQNGGRNTDSGDPLGDATKWLYGQYLDGASGYQNAQALQLAIWWLEGEFHDWGGSDPLAAWASFYNGRVSGIGTLAAGYIQAAEAAEAAGTAIPSDIRVLNLKDTINGGCSQDYIIRVVPEPASLLLLGTGLIGLALVRRRIG